MEFGLHLPNAGPFATGDAILAVARHADEAGYHSVWLFDHLFTPTQLDSRYPYSPDGSYSMRPEFPFFDPVAVMGVLAGATTRVRFGTRVLIPTYRHPVVLAKELATIDAVAGGRMILGVGAGWMAEEFDAVGVPMEGRFARMDEHIALMRQAWQQGISAFGGRLYSHVEAGFGPQPPKAGGTIPIIIGGHGDAALRRAAAYGDGWALSAEGAKLATDPMGAMQERIDTLRRYCDEAGRDFDDLLLLGQCGITDKPERVEFQAKLGVDICDVMSFGPAEQIIELSGKFLEDVASQFRS
jgi:probable F420-dependent oxidoreductase